MLQARLIEQKNIQQQAQINVHKICVSHVDFEYILESVLSRRLQKKHSYIYCGDMYSKFQERVSRGPHINKAVRNQAILES